MIVPAWPLRILPTSVSGDARPLTYRLRYHRARKDLANITYLALHRSHYLEQPLLDLHLLLVDQPLISVGRDARPLTYRLRYHRPRKDFANITHVGQPRCSTSDLSSALSSSPQGFCKYYPRGSAEMLDL